MAALGHFYSHHLLLMQHWLACYSSQILEVQYEETVADVAAQARRMLEFIGVEFESRVLNFHTNRRIVMTPSTQQVRQPIYGTSIDSWQRYGSALDPLITALQMGVAGA